MKVNVEFVMTITAEFDEKNKKICTVDTDQIRSNFYSLPEFIRDEVQRQLDEDRDIAKVEISNKVIKVF